MLTKHLLKTRVNSFGTLLAKHKAFGHKQFNMFITFINNINTDTQYFW